MSERNSTTMQDFLVSIIGRDRHALLAERCPTSSRVSRSLLVLALVTHRRWPPPLMPPPFLRADDASIATVSASAVTRRNGLDRRRHRRSHCQSRRHRLCHTPCPPLREPMPSPPGPKLPPSSQPPQRRRHWRAQLGRHCLRRALVPPRARAAATVVSSHRPSEPPPHVAPAAPRLVPLRRR